MRLIQSAQFFDRICHQSAAGSWLHDFESGSSSGESPLCFLSRRRSRGNPGIAKLMHDQSEQSAYSKTNPALNKEGPQHPVRVRVVRQSGIPNRNETAQQSEHRHLAAQASSCLLCTHVWLFNVQQGQALQSTLLRSPGSSQLGFRIDAIRHPNHANCLH